MGYNVNCGWSMKGATDADYLHLWTRLVLPLLREYNPELIVVAAGMRTPGRVSSTRETQIMGHL